MATEHLTLRIPHGATVPLESRIVTLSETDKVTAEIELHSEAGGPAKPVVTLTITRKGEFH